MKNANQQAMIRRETEPHCLEIPGWDGIPGDVK